MCLHDASNYSIMNGTEVQNPRRKSLHPLGHAYKVTDLHKYRYGILEQSLLRNEILKLLLATTQDNIYIP